MKDFNNQKCTKWLTPNGLTSSLATTLQPGDNIEFLRIISICECIQIGKKYLPQHISLLNGFERFINTLNLTAEYIHAASVKDVHPDGSVDLVHFSDLGGTPEIRIDKFNDVVVNSKWRVNNELDFQKYGNRYLIPRTPHEVLASANSLLAMDNPQYNVLHFNCQHVGTLIRYDVQISVQSDIAKQFLEVFTQLTGDVLSPFIGQFWAIGFMAALSHTFTTRNVVSSKIFGINGDFKQKKSKTLLFSRLLKLIDQYNNYLGDRENQMCSSIRYPRPYRSYVRHSHELHDDDECEHGLIYSSHGRGHESRSYSANNESWHINNISPLMTQSNSNTNPSFEQYGQELINNVELKRMPSTYYDNNYHFLPFSNDNGYSCTTYTIGTVCNTLSNHILREKSIEANERMKKFSEKEQTSRLNFTLEHNKNENVEQRKHEQTLKEMEYTHATTLLKTETECKTRLTRVQCECELQLLEKKEEIRAKQAADEITLLQLKNEFQKMMNDGQKLQQQRPSFGEDGPSSYSAFNSRYGWTEKILKD